ncbi:MAG: hypothetical protein ACI358_00710 [Candidatus Limimorpha sp.]
MKRILAVLSLAFLMCSCGVGVHSMSSGVESFSALTFIADTNQNITVVVDGQPYSVETVKLKKYRRNRPIKKTTENTIMLSTGQHELTVVKDGKEVLSKTVFLFDGETRVIEL